MADKYLDELVGTARQITGLNDDDIIHLLRQSDTTDRAGGSDYVIGGLDLMQWMGIKPLQTITLTSGAPGEFDFGPTLAGGVIPTTLGHRRLDVAGAVRSTAAGTVGVVVAFLNADTTTTNYHTQRLRALNGAASGPESTDSTPLLVSGAGSPAGAMSSVKLGIEGYAGSDQKLVYAGYNTVRSTANLEVGRIMVASSVTAAISRIRVRADSHPTDQLFGTLSLYLKF